jgi:hypothetical protein
MEAMMTHPFRRFIATLENVPRWFYAVALGIFFVIFGFMRLMTGFA